jgi:endonuclease/exonuclease/phosphatase family metal-dependent hydrolase
VKGVAVITASNFGLSILTFNLLSDLSQWQSRRDLVLEGLLDLQPDLIALQEVRLPENTAYWLAEAVNSACADRPPYHVYLCRKTGDAGEKEALAFLSRIPVKVHVTLDLLSQNRVAQYLQLSYQGGSVIIANSHLYWQPGESEARNKQIEVLLTRLQHIPGALPTIICGDFNATPQSSTISRMKQAYVSAYETVHGYEPQYTAPTLLKRPRISILRSFIHHVKYLRLREFNLNWRGVLDYIFVDPVIKVVNCEVVLDRPATHDPKIYPSDHLGIYAQLEMWA